MGKAVTEKSAWEDCRTALRELGSGVKWIDVNQAIEAIARRSDQSPIAEDDIRRTLDEHAVVLTRGSRFPLFLSDGAGRYSLLEAPLGEGESGLSEAEIRNIMCGCLSRLGPALRTNLQLIEPEFKVEGKSVDIAAKGPHGDLWLIEIKIGTETGDGVAQAAGYVSLCRKHVHGYKSYFGLVLAPKFSAEAMTIAKDRQIRLFEYSLCAEYSEVKLI